MADGVVDKLEHAAALVRFHRISMEFARLGVELLEPHTFCTFLRTTADATERFARAAGTWDEGAYVQEYAGELEKFGSVVERLIRARSDG